MIEVPDYAKQQFPDGYQIDWAERRATFEYVSEFAESTYVVWTIVSIGLWMYWMFGFDSPYYWTGILFFSLYGCRKAFEEYKRWQHEIHVIVTAQGISYYYKFSGWLDRNPRHETITAISPAIAGPRQNVLERIWGWATGEEMARVTLSGASGMHLDARRIHPSVGKAIQNARGNRKTPTVESSTNLRDADQIARLIDGKKIDRDFGLQAIETLVSEATWGKI